MENKVNNSYAMLCVRNMRPKLTGTAATMAIIALTAATAAHAQPAQGNPKLSQIGTHALAFHTTGTRSLAATSSRCSGSYRTSMYAFKWPNSTTWWEYYCVTSDESIPGQLWYDLDVYYYSATGWVKYGRWFEHVTLQVITPAIDSCFFVSAAGWRSATFYRPDCP